MKQDRFLIGILVFIGLLVVAAVGLFFVRNGAPAYVAEDTPQGVIRNYIVALQKQDYERAYGYLADDPDKPTYDYFVSAYMTNQLDISNSALDIGDVQTQANNRVFVSVTVVHASTGVFDNGWSSADKATLVQQAGAWKISYLPYPYWGWDWYTTPAFTPVPVKR
jgi:hypothetical protein